MSNWTPIQPDTVIRITAQEFETNYVSRSAYDALRAELEQARAEITIIGASWQEEHTEKIRLEERLKMAEARIHNLRAELFEVLEDQE